MKFWIILERKQEEHEEDGIRWKAFPCIENDIQKTLDIVRDDCLNYWIVKESEI